MTNPNKQTNKSKHTPTPKHTTNQVKQLTKPNTRPIQINKRRSQNKQTSQNTRQNQTNDQAKTHEVTNQAKTNKQTTVIKIEHTGNVTRENIMERQARQPTNTKPLRRTTKENETQTPPGC